MCTLKYSEPVTGFSGGVMTGLESIWNGPVSCPPNANASRLGRMPPLTG